MQINPKKRNSEGNCPNLSIIKQLPQKKIEEPTQKKSDFVKVETFNTNQEN